MTIDQPRELTRDECFALLATTLVGRLARNDDAGPIVVPVNFVVRDGGILIRSVSGGKVEAARSDEAVSFEADGIDLPHRSGWSVLLRGRLDVLPQHEVEGLDSFAAGPDDELLRLEPAAVTGRRLPIRPAELRSWNEVEELGHVWFGADATDLMG